MKCTKAGTSGALGWAIRETLLLTPATAATGLNYRICDLRVQMYQLPVKIMAIYSKQPWKCILQGMLLAFAIVHFQEFTDSSIANIES